MISLVHSTDLDLSPADQPHVGLAPAPSNGLDKAILKRPILIIEDEAVIAWTLESLLEDMGFTQIAIASSAADAVEKAKQTAPELIVSDINLGAGELDGIAATTAVRGGVGTAVVFITAFASAEDRQRIARDVPGAALLRKPVDAANLRQAIASIFGGAH